MRGFRLESAQPSFSWDKLDDEASSGQSVEDGLECPVCWEGFNNANNLPCVLWCGHSLCKSCVMGLQWAVVKLPVVPVQFPFFISCPWCQFLSCRLVWEGKLKYPCTNFFLLWMVESARGDLRLCHPGLDTTVGAAMTMTNQGGFEHQGSRHCYQNAGPDNASSALRSSLLSNPNLRVQQSPNVFCLRRWLNTMLCVCARIPAKSLLLALFLLILFFVLPLSMVILAVYFVATLLFVFPCFLMVCFAFPSLGWLWREITT